MVDARAALIAALAVALVVDLLALDLGLVVGAGLSGELGGERLAHAQRTGDPDHLAGGHRRHAARAAHFDG